MEVIKCYDNHIWENKFQLKWNLLLQNKKLSINIMFKNETFHGSTTQTT